MMVELPQVAATLHVSSEVLKISVNVRDSWSAQCSSVDINKMEKDVRGFLWWF